MRCGCWPLVHSYEYQWFSQSFPSERTAGVSSRRFTVTNRSNSLTFTVASSFVCTSPLVATTVVGLWETITVSNSAEFRSFLLSMCIDAPESTTNSFSSGFITDGAGNQTSVSEKKGRFVLYFQVFGKFWPFSTRLRGRIARVLNLFLTPILKFWSVQTALVRIFELNHSERWTFAFSDVCVT